MRTYRQGANEKRTHVADFSDRLETGDTLASAVWTVTGGITTSGEAVEDEYAEIVAEGGTVNTSYTFQCVATTQEGRKHEKSFIVQVVDR